MNDELAIRRICNLPHDFRTGDRSAYDLVRASGIGQRTLTVESVLPVLKANPKLVEDWIAWSEDQRCTPAYGLHEENGQYVVGRYPDENRVVFDDRFAACADFIVKVVNLIW
jgi:hypothetical protein